MSLLKYVFTFLLLADFLAGQPVAAGPLFNSGALTRFEQRLAGIDAELDTLARFSLRSGVGPIGYRSPDYTNSVNTEWIRIDLGNEVPFDQVVLVPAICHDIQTGFRADGFPLKFRILAGHEPGAPETVLADFGPEDHLIPRFAPVVIVCPGVTASWLRLEATALSPRAFDGRYNLEIAEIMAFDGPENIALKRPVQVSSASESSQDPARHPSYVTDGFLPYAMHSAVGKPSIAYFGQTITESRPSFTIDLGAPRPLNRVHLHAVDVDDVFPQSLPFDFCLPSRMVIEGANRADFADAVNLVSFVSRSHYDRGPLIMLRFPEARCRYVRLTALDPYGGKADGDSKTFIGFAEIELFSEGVNVALGKPFNTSFKQANLDRSLATLTDGANFYGKILPLREWMEQLARRHDLAQERLSVEKEVRLRYARQKVLLQRMSWLAALLIAGLAFTILIDRLVRLRQVARVKERLAADLHDELGADLHTIGMLSDLAEDAKQDPAELSMLHGRIRSMTERSGIAVRHFADLLNANGLYSDLAADIRRASERIMAKFDKDIAIEGEEHLKSLSSNTCFDLLLFYKECLVNISRHSGATCFSTRLRITDNELELTVTDNGKGVEDRIPDSLRRRACLLGATIASETPEKGGTRITLRLKTRRWGRRLK
jgi:signal transduction histidine kinase